MARKKSNMVEDIYHEIKNRIIELKYMPGEALSVNMLADEFQVSRTTLKEVMMRLIADCLVEETPTKLVVSSFTITDIIEMCQVREALEHKAIELIFAKGGLSQIQIEELKRINESMRESVEEKDYNKNFLMDDMFHERLVEYAGNRKLKVNFDHIRVESSRGRWLTLINPNYEDALYEHGEIIRALLEKDLEHALKFIGIHLKRAEANFGSIYRSNDYENSFNLLRIMRGADTGSEPPITERV